MFDVTVSMSGEVWILAVERQARASGAWGSMAKPFDFQGFLETVGVLLHSPGAERVVAERRKTYS